METSVMLARRFDEAELPFQSQPINIPHCGAQPQPRKQWCRAQIMESMQLLIKDDAFQS
jgi:hypothetical protein